jgi:aspartate ammonia-lyase
MRRQRLSEPTKLYYGEETKKALAVLGAAQMPRMLVRSYGEVKLAALRAQQQTAHMYPDDYFPFLEKAAQNVVDGVYDASFPLPLAQGGAGTSIHMNMCEVIASAANEMYAESYPAAPFRAHPLDHVARFQSTNDTFPTAVIIMVYRELEDIESGIIKLQEQLVQRETQYENVLITGRTELQDALPMTLGQIFSAWTGPVERDRWRFNKLRERLRTIPLGGTAVGTGFSAPVEYVFAAEKELRHITKLPLSRSQNLCDQISHTDNLAECAYGMGLCADNLCKFAGDLLLYTSSLCGEMKHGEVQYGSTIMPDKVNPVLLELIRGKCLECSALAGLTGEYSRGGQLQLNANLPFMALEFVRMSEDLTASLSIASEKLMNMLQINDGIMEAHLASSVALLNVFKDVLSYTEIKSMLPEIRKAGITTKNALADFLETHTSLKREIIDEKLTVTSMTGYTK